MVGDDVWSGRRFGSYQLLVPLGRGAVATVHAARRQDGTEVAVKILTPFAEANPEVVRLFAGEMELSRRVDHPGVVRMHRSGDVAGSHFLEMELVRGRTAQELVEGGDRLDETTVVDLGTQVARALHAVHAARVAHRDVKPANLLVDDDGRVRLFDFGLAFDLDGPDDPPGRVYGSPQWLSPEQARSARVCCRSDLYSLGATLYRLSTGRAPFYGERDDLLAAHLGDDPVPPTDLGVSPGLSAAILRAMAKDPADRFPDGEAMAAALDAVEPAEPRRRGLFRRGR